MNRIIFRNHRIAWYIIPSIKVELYPYKEIHLSWLKWTIDISYRRGLK